MSTKSGTNTFHGSGAYMLRHQGLDANTFANNAQGIPKRDFRVDDAGGSIGGPILRNKLFFFSSYHVLRNDQETTSLLTVPTALERVGNFSQTFIRDENGNPVPARIFDPFNVTQINSDLYRRAEIPNAIIPNPDPYAVRMYSYYPLPNRTPEDVFNTNNFESTTTQTVRRHSSNNRVDFKWKDHAIYGSGGISYAEIVTPRPFGTAPFNDAAGDAQRQEPVYPGRRCGRAQPHAAARRPLRPQPREDRRASTATRKGSPTTPRSASPTTCFRTCSSPAALRTSTRTATTAATVAAATGPACRPAHSGRRANGRPTTA